MNSVNTNVGAMIALQHLNKPTEDLATAQNRINTGMKVATAKDNGAIWAIAQGQRADVRALGAVSSSLNRGISAVDVALAAGETVSDLLLQMKEKALAASDGSLTTSARAKAAGTAAITVQAEVMALGGAIVTVAATQTIDTMTDAIDAMADVDDSIANVSAALARLGTKSKSLETHATFVSKLSDTLE